MKLWDENAILNLVTKVSGESELVEEILDSDRCYGLVSDNKYLFVCEYGCNGADPLIVTFKKR